MAISGKAKQFLTLSLKVAIVAAAFYFVARQLSADGRPDINSLFQHLKSQGIAWIFFILVLSFLNRFLEIVKWQNLVSAIRQISIGESAKQVLAAMTFSVFTPGGIGEYAGKALFFENDQRKKIVFLNLICNGIQMVLSTVFGIFGLLYFNVIHPIVTLNTIGFLLAISCLLFVAAFFIRHFAIKGYSIEKLVHKVNALPKKLHRRNAILALCRYGVFSHQYYFLFVAFGTDLPYLTLMAAIASVYFLASALPTFQFLDFSVKGGIAVYFLGLLDVSGWISMAVTTIMWILNTVIPVAIGSWFVLNFKMRRS